MPTCVESGGRECVEGSEFRGGREKLFLRERNDWDGVRAEEEER